MKNFMVLLLPAFMAGNACARPVSYPGGWTASAMTMYDMDGINVNYTLDKANSVGYLGEYKKDKEYQFHGVSWNHVLYRKNLPGSQFNLYLKSAAGMAYSDRGAFDGKTGAAGFTGIETDWENRRFMASYENRATYAGDIDKAYEQSVMLGVAPYIGDYGDFHTWLMLQADHKPQDKDNFVLTPMVRFFKGNSLGEFGLSEHGDIMLSLTHQF